ncbi:DNA mismatch endonuclease (patch repair protein) [Brevundimonas nasdae]|uniref:very short patch repair endonuclease n=1 Tax=Brevundimonas nasdae TaxID=172043 RepID=UPI001912E40C|nr:very short patch repair endonuclease [Brevundimonas nasdae]MBK6023636.1 DNA mismatch endonuclease Vsr [Brevundimonas nasdae]MDQ0450288.1 DNA mismatch endonuclease (patch repair protein) [Brevundimonas nasdae]
MTDVFSAEKRSAVMRRIKGRDTAPELAVRRVLRAAGVGYRLGGCGLPGRPDVVMKGRRTVIFVHGCFWHGHDCARGARQPKSNADYWIAKINRNRARDAAAQTALEADGWRVLTAWECRMKTPGFNQALVGAVRDQAASAASD